MTDTALVVFDGVAKHFGDFIAVEPMNLDIREGEFLAIMESSVCGKTTMHRMLEGLAVPHEGGLRLDCKRLNELSTRPPDTTLVSQRQALCPLLPVQANSKFCLLRRPLDTHH